MGRSEDSYEDSYEDSFWDDYSTESEGSGESNLEDEDSSHENELQKTPEEDSSIEIEEDYSSYESDTDFWGDDYSNEDEYYSEESVSSSEYDESEDDSWESTSEEEKSSETEGAELQDAIDQTYNLKEYNNAYYYPHNTDLVTRIGKYNLCLKSHCMDVLCYLLIFSCKTNATKKNLRIYCTQERWITLQGLTRPRSTLLRCTPASQTPPPWSGRSSRRRSL